jgi:hypothetical protein
MFCPDSNPHFEENEEKHLSWKAFLARDQEDKCIILTQALLRGV